MGGGVLCPLPSRLVVGLGFGCAVRAWGLPLLGGLPLLFFPCLALLVSAPGCGVPSVAYVGFSCSSLARLLVAPGRPLAFPRGLFLSLCSFVIIPHFRGFIPHFFGIFVCLFCAEELSIARLSGGGQAPTTPHSQKITKLPSHWLKHNRSNGCSQAKLEPRKRVYNKLSRCQISIFGFYSLRTHNQNHPQKPKHYKLSSF